MGTNQQDELAALKAKLKALDEAVSDYMDAETAFQNSEAAEETVNGAWEKMRDALYASRRTP